MINRLRHGSLFIKIITVCLCCLFTALLAGCAESENNEITLAGSDRSSELSQLERQEPAESDTDVLELDTDEDSSQYLFDEATGILLFPELKIQCVIPSKEVMDKIELEFENVEAQDLMINHIQFKYQSDDGVYAMFNISRWEAEDWDVPKEFGPLPAEIARSADGKWVALHAPSDLVCDAVAYDENRKMNIAIQEVWDFINENEDLIINSVTFT